MIRFLIYILYFTLFLGINVSCINGDSEKRYLIGVSQCSDDEWRDKLNKEMSIEAKFRGNIDLIIRSANDNNQKQVNDILYFIDQKVDLIIVSPNESAPITSVVEKAWQNNIPVIVSDRKIYSDKYTAYIGPDNFEIGALAGMFIVNYLKGEGKIVELKGTEGASPTIERHEGFMSIIKNYPNIKIVYQASGSFRENLGEKRMEEALSLNTDIDLVFAHNDRMAKGAYKSSIRRGRNIPFVGIDALPGEGYGIDMILDDMLVASFVNPTGGDKIIDLAMNILQNRHFQRETILPTTQVDKTNAKTLKLQYEYSNGLNDKMLLQSSRIDRNMDLLTRQRILLCCVVIILILLFCLLLLTVKAFFDKKKNNAMLVEVNKKIEDKNEQLECQKKQLIGLTEQLRKATQAKLAFYTNISHDFLTPITLIIEPIEQLLQGSHVTEMQYELLTIIKRNANILHRLVKQILDFRKFEEGHLHLNLSKSNIRDCLEKWSDAFRPLIKHRNIKYTFNATGDYSEFNMELDYDKIERLFYNLLSNALKYTERGGRVTVDLYTEFLEKEQYVVIKITDTGTGISSENVDKIFDVFFRENESFSGTGIGLALVKAFVDLHNGKISVLSNEGKGTSFFVRLPFRAEKEGTHSYSFAVSNKELENSDKEIEIENLSLSFSSKDKPSVLLVDDNGDVLEYLRLLLQTSYTILLAKNGETALKMAVQYNPDLIISDIMMPVMNGFELCSRLKEEPITQNIPIILLTAQTLDKQKIKGLKCGADVYLEKPFNTDVLLLSIKNMILKKEDSELTKTSNNVIKAPTENLFTEKIYALLEQYASDSSFTVEELGHLVGLSRVQLYRKVKELTTYSPNELLKVYRLQKAKKLLTKGKSISEIAYEVGFTSPSYFAKCYKDFYEETPTTYLKRMTTK